MKLDKKGISPLIATVLLIGFTVALAALITTWGVDFFRGTTATVDQQQQKSFLCVNQLDFALEVRCAENKIFVDNRGELDIVSIKLRVQDQGGEAQAEEREGVPAFGKKGYDITNGLETVEKVDVTAIVQAADGSQVICTDARREVQVSCAPAP